MNIVFMGTPVFALASLEALIKAGHNISCVFTQPDKPKNRGHKIQMTPIKELALEHKIPVYQPLSLKKGEDADKSYELLKKLKPDCIAVAAYGQILPQRILDLPKYGCINVHASLLERYRGASPINSCIINGETETGISIMYMAQGLDCGDVILREKVEIPVDMNASQLHDILKDLGAELLLKALELLENGTAARTAQKEENACYAPLITKDMCRIDWEKPAVEIYNLIRGLSETPAAYTFLEGKRLKIYSAAISELTDKTQNIKPSAVICPETFTVSCGGGTALALTDIQLEGSRRMPAGDFLRGRKLPDSIG